MAIGQPANFPTLDTIMQLVRSLCRDTFSGVGGQQGRIFTNDAPFTLPFLNSAIRWMNRALRNEGVTFPIRDNVNVLGLAAQTNMDPATIVSLSFDGWNNGTVVDGSKRLPGDCFQPLAVWQRQSGQNQAFVPMTKAQEGLLSAYPQQWFGQWEWRNYSIVLNGSLQVMDLRLRYVAGQAPFQTLPADFETTTIHVQDCEEAIANKMAAMYGRARNAEPTTIAPLEQAASEAIEEMALAYVRTQQTTNYNRPSYQGGGSNSQQSGWAGEVGGEF